MVDGSLPGTPASSTTKTGRHVIAEILLKVALNNKNQSIIINQPYFNLTNTHGKCINYLPLGDVLDSLGDLPQLLKVL